MVLYRRTRQANEAQAAFVAEAARRAASEAAWAAEARFHAIFNSDPNGILAVDRAGIIRLANPRLTNMFGYEAEELIGKPVDTLVPSRLRDDHKHLRDAFIAWLLTAAGSKVSPSLAR